MPKRYSCPVELTVDVIGGRWRTVILARLKEGVHRYGEPEFVKIGETRGC